MNKTKTFCNDVLTIMIRLLIYMCIKYYFKN